MLYETRVMTIRQERMVIMKFSELKQMVSPADSQQLLPGNRQLLGTEPKIVVSYNIEDMDNITVYDNGYVLFCSGSDHTVFRLHDCKDYVDRDDPQCKVISEKDFDEMHWALRLILEGEDRIAHNKEKKEYHHTVSYSAVAEDWVYLSDSKYDGALVLLEKEEHQELIHKLQIQLAVLTDRQRFVFTEIIGNGKTHKEVAEEIGISRQAVTDALAKALKKYKKNQK